jgi:hypothetical protein
MDKGAKRKGRAPRRMLGLFVIPQLAHEHHVRNGYGFCESSRRSSGGRKPIMM